MTDEIAIIRPLDGRWVDCEVLEAEVFVNAGYVDDIDEIRCEYAPYFNSSVFAASMNGESMSGCVRLIGPGEAGFKTAKDCADGRLHVSAPGQRILGAHLMATEVGTIAVPSAHRAREDQTDRVAFQLYGAVLWHAEAHNARWILASFDEAYFHRFRSIFGKSVIALGDPTPYMGSPTVAVAIDLPLFLADLANSLPEASAALRAAANRVRA